MDVQELIERGYRALGLGADDDVLAMFDQLGGEPADWVVYELGAFGRRHPASHVVAMEQFGGLPSHFEVIGSSPPMRPAWTTWSSWQLWHVRRISGGRRVCGGHSPSRPRRPPSPRLRRAARPRRGR
jgi:hypothetical protein